MFMEVKAEILHSKESSPPEDQKHGWKRSNRVEAMIISFMRSTEN